MVTFAAGPAGDVRPLCSILRRPVMRCPHGYVAAQVSSELLRLCALNALGIPSHPRAMLNLATSRIVGAVPSTPCVISTVCVSELFPVVLRYTTLLVFALYSFWIPQIVLCVVTDARQGLKPAYVAGMSALRLALPLYVWACPRNLLKVPPSYGNAAGLVAFVGLQARKTLPERAA